jgi:hypothetical protein
MSGVRIGYIFAVFLTAFVALLWSLTLGSSSVSQFEFSDSESLCKDTSIYSFLLALKGLFKTRSLVSLACSRISPSVSYTAISILLDPA